MDHIKEGPCQCDICREKDIVSMVVERMRYANWDPAFIYAFERTGRLVTKTNLHLFSADDIRKWKEAVAEYRRNHPAVPTKTPV